MKKMKLYGLAGVAALAAVGGTFAYYNASQTFVNPFDTENYSTGATEQFNPGDGHDWKPGAFVDKKVLATNTGDGNVWVRVKLDEVWTFDAGATDATSLALAAGNTNFFPGSETTGIQGSSVDGLVNGDGSVVYKNLVTGNIVTTAPTAEGSQWYFNADDGYYYYAKALVKDESTVDLMNGLTLCEDTDMGHFVDKGYFTIGAKNLPSDEAAKLQPELKADGSLADGVTGWYELNADGTVPTKGVTTAGGVKSWVPCTKDGEDITFDADTQTVYTYKVDHLVGNEQGYANADYKLNITVEFVQADEEAAQAFPTSDTVTAWSWYPGKNATVGDNTPDGE